MRSLGILPPGVVGLVCRVTARRRRRDQAGLLRLQALGSSTIQPNLEMRIYKRPICMALGSHTDSLAPYSKLKQLLFVRDCFKYSF